MSADKIWIFTRRVSLTPLEGGLVREDRLLLQRRRIHHTGA